ncbi:MAG TPA: helix-turn-helix transcriptional regulator [Candidatus Dormibacteraeota bacterium]|jgi:DNA-binding NarL/FixJ family response regulator
MAIHLSPRQEEVLRLIADGYTDKEIAARLGLRTRTVRTHLERLFARHGLHNRAGMLTVWFRSQASDVGGNADL